MRLTLWARRAAGGSPSPTVQRSAQPMRSRAQAARELRSPASPSGTVSHRPGLRPAENRQVVPGVFLCGPGADPRPPAVRGPRVSGTMARLPPPAPADRRTAHDPEPPRRRPGCLLRPRDVLHARRRQTPHRGSAPIRQPDRLRTRRRAAGRPLHLGRPRALRGHPARPARRRAAVRREGGCAGHRQLGCGLRAARRAGPADRQPRRLPGPAEPASGRAGQRATRLAADLRADRHPEASFQHALPARGRRGGSIVTAGPGRDRAHDPAAAGLLAHGAEEERAHAREHRRVLRHRVGPVVRGPARAAGRAREPAPAGGAADRPHRHAAERGRQGSGALLRDATDRLPQPRHRLRRGRCPRCRAPAARTSPAGRGRSWGSSSTGRFAARRPAKPASPTRAASRERSAS